MVASFIFLVMPVHAALFVYQDTRPFNDMNEVCSTIDQR
jgi:hypothetical protein